MEINTTHTMAYLAILLTGLSAGLFYAWAVSVIPGTKKTRTKTYLETMQTINRAILNPAFFLVFFGSPILLAVCTIQLFLTEIDTSFWLMLGATLTYLVGTFGVTVFGNVPLNQSLDSIRLNDLEDLELTKTRMLYEEPWNELHVIRTGCSVLAFMLSLFTI